MSDELKYTADVEAQENETLNSSDELTDEELDQVAGGREAGSGQATGRRQYEPITLIKRVDKDSP